jgi:citronellol/citronellal dehydrogenase
MSLANRTLFITGASRGIGRAIAMRAAQDGANIVIAAKSDRRHPKLPGTIHSVAEEIVAAGGQALALKVDVRDENNVAQAVTQAVEHFGRLDVLVNNASAIYLKGTLDVPMKRYDLMHDVNVRGSFCCAQACVPHLLKSDNPHILTLSPPLNLSPRWFAQHTAYTMSKYAMSMCSMGLAAEFGPQGVSVNALWPRTVINTAALAMLGGQVQPEHCRQESIMADAAHAILTKPSGHYCGEFLIDEDVLRAEGIETFDHYAVSAGQPLAPDLFLDAD